MDQQKYVIEVWVHRGLRFRGNWSNTRKIGEYLLIEQDGHYDCD